VSDWKFKKWYEENKGTFNAARKERYKNDPEYKAKVLRQNQEARRRRKERAIQEGAQRRLATKVTLSPGWKEVDTLYDMEGNVVDGSGVTIGAVAGALGRSPQTLRLWEERGVIPGTPYRSGRGDRVYTMEQIAEIRELAGTLPKRKQRAKDAFLFRSIVQADGTVRSVRLFRVGMLAEAIDRTRVALVQLERQGRLPRTPLRMANGHRLYTYEMIIAVRDAFDNFDGRLRGEKDWMQLYASIRAAWEDQGIWGSQLGTIARSL
jgi:DNA-binding transcriptional MerR regulator